MPRTITDDHRELTNPLFATATAMLEDVIEVAVAGQSARRNASQIANDGRRLQAVVRDIAIIAEAAVIVASLSANRCRSWRNPRS